MPRETEPLFSRGRCFPAILLNTQLLEFFDESYDC